MFKIYIIILNWNGWRDTIECFESVFRNNYKNYQVIVCDNDSHDGSLEYIKKWAEGELEIFIQEDNPLRHLAFPPVRKPIEYVEYEREEAEAGGRPEDSNAQLILIQTGGNLGFAGGNNVGLRYALARDDFDYVWLLNNDTVIDPNALSALVARMQVKPSAGMCGSTLLYYDNPDIIQALGGATYNKWLARPRHIGAFKKKNNISIDQEKVESKMDYVVGASMLVSKDFLKDIGLMNEEYFLYFEEIDWATRARGKYSMAYAPRSVVYHKEGSSISSGSTNKSRLADYYGIINRIIFTRKYYKYALPVVYIGFLIVIFNRIRRCQWNRASMILNIIFRQHKTNLF